MCNVLLLFHGQFGQCVGGSEQWQEIVFQRTQARGSAGVELRAGAIEQRLHAGLELDVQRGEPGLGVGAQARVVARGDRGADDLMNARWKGRRPGPRPERANGSPEFGGSWSATLELGTVEQAEVGVVDSGGGDRDNREPACDG